MKKIFLAAAILLMTSLISTAVLAQSEEAAGSYPVPKWVSANGYWVVESNINTPKVNTIYFYNNNHVMVYKENLNGVVIRLKKRSVKMGLKKLLDQAVLAYNEKQKATENEMLVMNLVRK